jgi:hypothetical protein
METSMKAKLKAALIAFLATGVLAIQSPAYALTPNDIVGTWKIVSYVHEAAGKTEHPLGEHPSGYLVIGGDHRCTQIVVGQGRKPAHDDEGYANLVKSMISYSAPFTYEDHAGGLKITLRPDVSWNPAMTGASIIRFVSLEGDRLTVKGPQGPAGAITVKFERAKQER